MNTSRSGQYSHYGDDTSSFDDANINNHAGDSLRYGDRPALYPTALEAEQIGGNGAHMDMADAYNSAPSARKDLLSDIGQKVRAASEHHDGSSDISFLDSLALPGTSGYTNLLDSPSPNQLLNHYLSSGPSNLSDQDPYGFQHQAQSSSVYGQSSIFGAPSSYSTPPNEASAVARNENGANLHIDFDTFSNQLRQYQQSAMASQNSNDAPYFQHAADVQHSRRSTHSTDSSHSPHDHLGVNTLQHYSFSSSKEMQNHNQADRQRMPGSRQAGLEMTVSSTVEAPTDPHFVRHQVHFSRALWDASDVSREPGLIAEQRQVGLAMPSEDIPAKDQHFLYHSSSLSPTHKRFQGPPTLPQALPISVRSSEQLQPVSFSDNKQPFTPHFEQTQESGTSGQLSSQEAQAWSKRFSIPSAQQQLLSFSQASTYRTQYSSSLSNPTESEGSGSRYALSDWSNSSRHHPQAVAPIHMPGSYREDDDDGARRSLSSAGSSAGERSSSHRSNESLNAGTPPPQSPKGMNPAAPYSQTSVSHSENGKRLYECKICSRKFPRPSALVVHERIHSGDKPFVCEVCDRPFTVASNLRRHQKIHAKELHKQAATDARATESISMSTVRAKGHRSKPYALSSGQHLDRDLAEANFSGEIDDGSPDGRGRGSVSSLSALQSTDTRLHNIMEWTQKTQLSSADLDAAAAGTAEATAKLQG